MNKRLMKLAGLLKEEFELPDESPFDKSIDVAKAEEFIEDTINHIINQVREDIKKLNKGTFNIYDVASSRGFFDGSLIEEGLSEEVVVMELESKLKERYKDLLQSLIEDGEDLMDGIEEGNEYIGGVYVETVHGFTSLDISMSEESFIAIINSVDKEKLEKEYRIY